MGLLYTRAKIFHFGDKLESLPASSASIEPPLHVRIKPTNACAHNCRYCAYRVSNLQLGRDMNERDSIPGDKMLEILEDLVAMGVRAVTFSGGGDPFYYQHLTEAVRRLSESPVKFAALTNGSRLEGELAELFALHGTWLRVSIDGWDDASYARYREVRSGEFTRVVTNMKRFKSLQGPCNLGISMVVDQENYRHIYDIAVRMKDIGADSIKVSPCIVSNYGRENNEYHRPIFPAVQEQVNQATADLGDEHFQVYNAFHRQLETFEKPYSWCPYLQILPVIGADLNVYSCQDKAYNLTSGLLGSLDGVCFRDFWFSGKDKFFTINPARHCNHHCVADARNRLVLEYLEADHNHLAFV